MSIAFTDRLSNLLQLAAGISVVGACYLITLGIYNAYFHPLSRFPGPKHWAAFRLPYVLSLHSGKYHQHLKAFHERYGDIVRVAPNELSFTDVRAWKDIYTNRPGHALIPRNPVWFRKVKPDDPVSIMGDSEEDHSRIRKILTNAFSEKSLKAQAPMIQGYANLLVEQLKAREGETVNMVDWLNFFTFDMSGDLSFGEPFGCLKEGKPHPWVEISYNFGKGVCLIASVNFYPAMHRVMKYLIPRKVVKTSEDHRRMTNEKVHKRLAYKERRPDIIDTINTQNEAKGDKAMNLPEIELNMSILVFAGSETTATALSGIIRMLLQNPEAMEKLIKEVRSSFESESDITIASAAKLEYVKAVIDEGMRLCPPTTIGVPRITPPQGEQICEQWIPGNTLVTVNQYPAFRSPKSFTRPEEFVPERFLSTSSTGDERSAFWPFQLGRHSCIGQTLAYAVMRLILTKLFFTFDFSLADETDVWDWGVQDQFLFWEKKPLGVKLRVVEH